MKYIPVYLFLWAGLLAGNTSCLSTKKSGSDTREKSIDSIVELPEAAYAVVPDTFVLPPVPETITVPEERAAYLVMHYWDRFDFADRGLIDRPEITEQAFVDYVNILDYVPEERADESLLYTLQKAAADTVMYEHFASLFEKVLLRPQFSFPE